MRLFGTSLDVDESQKKSLSGCHRWSRRVHQRKYSLCLGSGSRACSVKSLVCLAEGAGAREESLSVGGTGAAAGLPPEEVLWCRSGPDMLLPCHLASWS